MEKNTVLLSVEAYNELRDFKKKVEEGKIYAIRDYRGRYNSVGGVKFLTENEAVKIIADNNEALERQNKEQDENISKLHKQNIELTVQLEKAKSEGYKISEPNKQSDNSNLLINQLTQMSIWEFRRWRKNNKQR